MKQSHVTTPRHLGESCWDLGGEAFHGFPEPAPSRRWDDWALVIVAGLVVVLIAGGWI